MLVARILQVGATILLNISFAWMVGALLARAWLRNADLEWKTKLVAKLRPSEIAAAALCFLGSCAALWAAAAVMSGLPLWAALDTLWVMLSKTSYGQAGLAGLFALAALVSLNMIGRRRPAHDFAIALALLGFAASRVAESHAAENGLLSLGFLVEWTHLLLIAVWAGGVAIAGWLVLPTMRAPEQPPGSATAVYLSALSHASTLALAGIFATGIYNALLRLGVIDNIVGNTYGTALIIKLSMVLLAAALGAYNRFIGFPSLASSSEWMRSVVIVLRVESAILFAAFVAAAALTSQQPPASF